MNNLYDTFISHLYSENAQRIEAQEKLFDYYSGNETAILNYLKEVQNISFSDDEIQDFQKLWVNLVKKIVNQMSVVYRKPADRYLINNDGEFDEIESDYHNNLLPANINTIDNQALRYGKLFNTSLTFVDFDINTQKLIYKVLPSHLYNIIPDDNNCYKIKELVYAKYFIEKGEQVLYAVVWTDTEHYRMELTNIKQFSVKGGKLPIGNNTEMKNPYGIIPYAVLRLEEQNDFWGNGLCDAVAINEQVNFLLSDLINSGCVMQGWGTPIAINCGFASTNREGGTDTKKVRIGVKHPIVVDGVTTDMVQPSFEYKSANPLITEIRNSIDWLIKLFAVSKGMNPNSFAQEVQATSGFSKLVDMVEQLELRKDDIEPCRIYEEERYKISKKVLESYKSDIKQYKEIKGDLVVDFAELEQPESIDDKIKRKEFKLKYNLISVIDLAREDNPDLTDEQLKEVIELNKEINSEFISSGIPNSTEAPDITGGGNAFFKQDDSHSCGECAVNSILAMYGKTMQRELDTDEGMTPDSLVRILSENGIKATAKEIDIAELKPKSIVYYDGNDHYVTVEKIESDRILINDSLKNAPEWKTKEEFIKLWDGWVLETELKKMGF